MLPQSEGRIGSGSDRPPRSRLESAWGRRLARELTHRGVPRLGELDRGKSGFQTIGRLGVTKSLIAERYWPEGHLATGGVDPQAALGE